MADLPRRKESLVRAILPGLEYRDGADGKRPVLSGHFSVFNSPTTIRSAWEGEFVETIAPGAFKKTIAENRDRMRVLLNHGNDPQLGDKPLGSISDLREDNRGAYYEVDLFDGIPPLVMDGLRAGAYGASFRFSVMNESWNERPARSSFNPDGLPERTIKEAKVAEFGPVTFGAYDEATAGVRSLTDRFLLDALAEDPDNLRELIQDRRQRTFTATAPNVRVTYGPKEPAPVVEPDRSLVEQMLELASQSDDERMKQIAASLRELAPDDGDAEPDEDEVGVIELEEPEPSEATTSDDRTEPELPVATTRAQAATTVDGLYIPNRKDTGKWLL